MSCDDGDRELSDGDGRVARRRDLRAHLRTCAGCRASARQSASRRRDLAALAPLPAVAAAGLLQGLLGAHGASGAGRPARSAERPPSRLPDRRSSSPWPRWRWSRRRGVRRRPQRADPRPCLGVAAGNRRSASSPGGWDRRTQATGQSGGETGAQPPSATRLDQSPDAIPENRGRQQSGKPSERQRGVGPSSPTTSATGGATRRASRHPPTARKRPPVTPINGAGVQARLAPRPREWAELVHGGADERRHSSNGGVRRTPPTPAVESFVLPPHAPRARPTRLTRRATGRARASQEEHRGPEIAGRTLNRPNAGLT